jgi:hypothetical protein
MLCKIYAKIATVFSLIVANTCCTEEIQQLPKAQHPAMLGLSHTCQYFCRPEKNVTWQENRYFQTELLGNALAR